MGTNTDDPRPSLHKGVGTSCQFLPVLPSVALIQPKIHWRRCYLSFPISKYSGDKVQWIKLHYIWLNIDFDHSCQAKQWIKCKISESRANCSFPILIEKLYYKTKMGTIVVLNIVKMKYENNHIFFQTLINVSMPLCIQILHLINVVREITIHWKS